MKKIITFLLSVIVLFSVLGCANSNRIEYVDRTEYINNYRNLDITKMQTHKMYFVGSTQSDFYANFGERYRHLASDDFEYSFLSASSAGRYLINGRKRITSHINTPNFYMDNNSSSENADCGYIDTVINEVRVYSDFVVVYYDIMISYNLTYAGVDKDEDNPKRLYFMNCVDLFDKNNVRIDNSLYFISPHSAG